MQVLDISDLKHLFASETAYEDLVVALEIALDKDPTLAIMDGETLICMALQAEEAKAVLVERLARALRAIDRVKRSDSPEDTA